jgi:hypothetical protein
MNSRIIGGKRAKYFKFSWIASQEHMNKNVLSDSECGASLINDE